MAHKMWCSVADGPALLRRYRQQNVLLHLDEKAHSEIMSSNDARLIGIIFSAGAGVSKMNDAKDGRQRARCKTTLN